MRQVGVLTIPLVAALSAGSCAAPDAGEQTPGSDLPDRPVTDIDIHADYAAGAALAGQGPSKYSTTIRATAPMRISATADGPAISLL